jgi:hypothetical protein
MHAENGCFVLTCHPFVSGRASRIALLDDLVTCMRRARGVWFTTCEEIARWHASGPAAADWRPTPGRPTRATAPRSGARGRRRR